MTKEPMKWIPLSVIDALILDFETNGYRNNYDTKDIRDILEMIKKEAIIIPLKQRIQDRIVELEAEEHSNYEYKAYQQGGLDELRKLLK